MSVLSASFRSEWVHKPLVVDEWGGGICPSREIIPKKSGFGVGGLSTGSKPLLEMGAPVRFVVHDSLAQMPGM